jgi:hypothetical protein
LLLIRLPFFEPFPIVSPEDEHPDGDQRKKDKNIGLFPVYIPEGGYFVNRDNGYSQVKVFGISEDLDHD